MNSFIKDKYNMSLLVDKKVEANLGFLASYFRVK